MGELSMLWLGQMCKFVFCVVFGIATFTITNAHSDVLDDLKPSDESSPGMDVMPDKERLKERVRERYEAFVKNDLRRLYETKVPEYRQPYESWKKIWSKKLSDTKISSVEPEKICDCNWAVFPNGRSFFRCTVLLRLTFKDESKDDSKALEMWQIEDGEWYQGYADHHDWEDCPGK
ncbi:hypothetical protein BOV90_01370 [Solemya velum gill symbiont]|uniref:Uncharacterized protein n=2 Tax=Solemya velum gill symbiont TaxID=2340 RepID=A0A1T2GNS7_SOVGS|nr:hypothetical protein BOV88_03750 [Solemya velum gill symbiont]OOY38389.1 hypothetical protein BOV89_03015 [Solemya velum gill symbiont]OOY40987.1 hypothetical protein BOV90_01370 [Solemya velum gill symbiont]OOY42997.1 hypothetical protein BOV91_05290 [Solemya velum gill symbiont]OOY53395.1 hypothetical protein BOV97_03540 [Solemya velum gill symbiont]